MPLLNTISRAGNVLALFTAEHPEWGVRETATELGMPRSNAHMLMSSLTDIGLFARTSDLRYRLGWRLLTLSGCLLRAPTWPALALRCWRSSPASSGTR